MSAVFLSIIIINGSLEFLGSKTESYADNIIGFCILVVYLLFLLQYFVVNEGRKYTVSAFSISVIMSTVAVVIYDQQVGGHFWNDNYVLEDSLLASIRPPIILFVINELVGAAVGAYNRIANAERNYPTSLIRIGLVASLPLVVMNPPWTLGMIILIPTLAIFFLLYVIESKGWLGGSLMEGKRFRILFVAIFCVSFIVMLDSFEVWELN